MGYYLDMQTPLQTIPTVFDSWITREITPDGLLEEIDKYCSTFRTDGSVLNHEIWTRKLDWSISSEETYSIGDTMSNIIYPFEVAIIVDALDDFEVAEQKAIQLQAKTIMSIFKNYDPRIFPAGEGYINHFTIEEGYNDGSINPLNQEDDVIIKGFKVTLYVYIDWIECMRKAEAMGKTTQD